MNYFIQDFCCLCLSISNKKCSNNSSKYPDNLTPLDKIKTVFLGLSSVMESDDKICMKCSDTVGFIYEFHKTCLRNINIFSSYKNILKENLPKKQCELFVDLNKSKIFKENILISKEIKVELPESPLNNDDTLCDADFVSEGHAIGAVEIKEEIEINYVTHNVGSETIWVNSNAIKIEYDATDLERELMNETNKTSDIQSFKSNIKDYENISVQSTEEVVNVKEENQELIEDPLREATEEKSDEERGNFELFSTNRSKSSDEKPIQLEKNVDSYSNIFIHSERKIHSRKEPHNCEVCGKFFSRKADLKRHSLIHTGEKSYNCEICGKLFMSKGNLKTHMLIHTGEKPHSCNICGKLFKRKQELKFHMLLHTGEKPHKCNICGKSFNVKGHLQTHMLIHTGEKPHKCNICGKSFGQINTLDSHKLIHTGEKPHKCDVCGKLFNHKANFNRHLLIHTGAKSHKCEVCGKLFNVKANLQTHKLTHTGEKPHKCDICGKSFIRKQYLKTHMLVHSDEKPQRCDI